MHYKGMYCHYAKRLKVYRLSCKILYDLDMPSLDTIVLILFIVWGIPLGIFRSRFRKKVYQTSSWTINIKPFFWKELRALFGNLYPHDEAYIRLRNFYRIYLLIYTTLFVLYMQMR